MIDPREVTIAATGQQWARMLKHVDTHNEEHLQYQREIDSLLDDMDDTSEEIEFTIYSSEMIDMLKAWARMERIALDIKLI